VSDGDCQLHLFLISSRTGATCVFLIETEPGVVEFPQITVEERLLDDEPELVRRIAEATGLEVGISGFLSPGAQESLGPGNSRFLIGRVTGGTPRPAVAHLGWEWRPGSNLLTLQFLPKIWVDELRVFMNS
jgi:hypothetical protein